MSTPEAAFRALLAGHAALTAIVGTKIALNSIPPGGAPPLVVFVTTKTPELGLDNTVLATACIHATQCWGTDSTQANAIADAVRGAIATNSDYVITGESSVFEESLGLDGVEITVERWIT
jgi:hypothetical protein